MTLAAPLFLLALLLVPAIWIASGYASNRRSQRALAMATTPIGQKPPSRRKISLFVISAAIVFGAVALSQPQWGTNDEEAPQTGRDIIVLLDTSLSMAAEDVAPNRLAAAKLAVLGLVDEIAIDGGHRVALVAFSGRAILLSPLTLDYNLFRERLDGAEIGAISLEGSALADAVVQSVDRVRGFRPGFTDMIIVSDGEGHDNHPLVGAVEAADNGIDLYTLGVGQPGDGVQILVAETDGTRSPVTFDGFPVLSRVDEQLLSDMAETGNGMFLGSGEQPRVLVELFDDVISEKPVNDLSLISNELPAHRFQWFLLVCLILMAFHFVWARRSGGVVP